MNKIYCDECGEMIVDSHAVVYKDISESIISIFCDDDCFNNYTLNKKSEVFINTNGVIEKY